MIGREYKDSHGVWHNIEANDYDDMQEQISSIEKGYEKGENVMDPLDIAKEYLCTANETHNASEESENVFRDIFSLISVDIDAAVRYHKFDTVISFNWDIKYVNDVIDTLKKLGYQAELISKPEYDRLHIKW